MSKQQTRSGERRNPKGLFVRNGRWYWRINRPGLGDKIGDTSLEAIQQNEMAALFQRADALRELKRGLAGCTTKKDMPFVKGVPIFLEWYRGEHRDHPNTGKRASGSMASLGMFFGHTLIRNIGPGQLDNFKTWRRNSGVAEVTIRHDCHNLSALFQYGMRQGWCDANPVDGIEIPSDKDAIRINFISKEAEEKYFAAAKKRSVNLYDAGRVMVVQGPRPEEVMKMRKCDIRDGTHMYVYGKSTASKRWLLMEKETAEILLPRLKLPGDWLFPSDSPLNRGGHIMTLQRAHDDVLEETGLTFNIYDFRHTFATRKAIGPPPMPLPVLAALMGHANTASLNKYVHPFQHLMDEAMRGTPSQAGTNVVEIAAPSPVTRPSQFPPQTRHSFRHSSVTDTRSKKEHKRTLVAPRRGRPPKG